MSRQERYNSLPDGPWKSEPNKVQWVSKSTDLDCLIVRGPMGALCGYVGVPKGNPLYGLDYDDEKVIDLDVHGGLTYAAPCQENDPDGICHVPEPGRPADVWWFGFDCSHYMDLIPSMLKYDTIETFTRDTAVYRDIDYVKGQCTTLAKQIRELM